MIRIVVAADHRILRDSMRRAFDTAGEAVVGEATDGVQAVELARALEPDVVLMDLAMPGLGGVAATRCIRAAVARTKVILLTMQDDVDRTEEALAAGASAYLTTRSSLGDLLRTVRGVAGGDIVRPIGAPSTPAPEEPVLSDRQVEILQLIARGCSIKQAARELGITQKTVHNHLNAIYRRLDTQNLTHAVLSAVRLGIVELV